MEGEREKSKEESGLAALLHVKSVLDVPGRDGLHKYDGPIHAHECRACTLRAEVLTVLSRMRQ